MLRREEGNQSVMLAPLHLTAIIHSGRRRWNESKLRLKCFSFHLHGLFQRTNKRKSYDPNVTECNTRRGPACLMVPKASSPLARSSPMNPEK